MNIFCVNGISLAGKDSFVDRVIDKSLGCYFKGIKISTIDPIKDIYEEFFGWDGTKTPEHRKNLNLLKMIWKGTSNGPLNWTKNRIAKYNEFGFNSLFIMVREFDEMQSTIALAIALGHKAYTLQVVREGIPIPPIEQEFLDSHPEGYEYDITIYNPTVETFPHLPLLDEAAIEFVKVFIACINTDVQDRPNPEEE